ncbi:sulfurtransferase complex subunit TusC [Oceanospirillum sediminis]|uniref:Sulfurtransferase complex subunit TusC n=1 Tax=Oceanospirillum sediminis TaxID=2760088 RepID=A0A839IU39_9GAMM|nr:sulfurtransferase complex subunit TusC [Oceanospirillum sediminis]MBB1488154.1 sulfurtransferase complex subunit TusC [Oceanospirillum sediminis]
MSDILIIFRKPPAGTSWAREAMDLALVGAAFGQQVSLLFMGDGVFQLTQNQQPDVIGQKGTQAMMQALPMYDIDQVFVHQDSMDTRGMSPDNLNISCQAIDSKALPGLLQQHKQVFNF